jgi:hypothetical protein
MLMFKIDKLRGAGGLEGHVGKYPSSMPPVARDGGCRRGESQNTFHYNFLG